MKLSHVVRVALSTLFVSSLSAAFAAEPKPKNKVLVDFTHEAVEVDGGVPKPVHKYDYSYEAWQGKLIFLEGKGVLIPALSGRGGMGKDAKLNFGTSTQGQLEVAIGARNEAESFTVSMVDSDGTEVSWYLQLKDKPKGVPLSFALPLESPHKEDKPGKKPGFDKAKIKTWQIKGNWQEPKVEIVLIRLSALAP